MAKANLNESGRELTVNFNHEQEAGERKCSYCKECGKNGVKYTVTVTSINEGMVKVSEDDDVYRRAARRAKTAAQHGKILCDEHYSKLVAGELHIDQTVKPEFGAEAV